MSPRQRAATAIEDIRQSATLSVEEAALRHGVSMSVIYKLWHEMYPGTVPRGTGCDRALEFGRLCERMLRLVSTEDTPVADIMRDMSGRGISDRRAYRVLKKLVEDGRLQRSGGRTHAYYRRIV